MGRTTRPSLHRHRPPLRACEVVRSSIEVSRAGGAERVKELKRRVREDLKIKGSRRCARNVSSSDWVCHEYALVWLGWAGKGCKWLIVKPLEHPTTVRKSACRWFDSAPGHHYSGDPSRQRNNLKFARRSAFHPRARPHCQPGVVPRREPGRRSLHKPAIEPTSETRGRPRAQGTSAVERLGGADRINADYEGLP